MRIIRAVMLVLILAFGLLPFLVTVVAGRIARMAGCELHEGYATECVIRGMDVGEVLYAAGLSFWVTVLAMPTLAVACGLWLMVEIVVAVRRVLTRFQQSSRGE